MKRFLALILALSLLLVLPSCGKREPDYISGDMTDWFDIALADFTGGTYDVDLPNEITDEDVYKELRWLQLYYALRGNTAAGDLYLSRPEFSDVVFFYYDVALTPDGEGVFSNIFSADGAEKVTVGLWEFPHGKVEKANALFDNKLFSDTLTQTQPAGRVTEGVVEAGDVVVLSYTTFNAENVLQESATNVRINTHADSFSHYENVHPKAILSDLIGKTLGEEYTVTQTVLPEGGGEEVTYTYRYKIAYKAEETFSTVEIPLAEDAFDDTYSEALQALNGKTVYVRFFISRFIDYDPPALDSTFYIETLGLTTKETDVEKIEKEAHAAIKAKLADARLTEQVYPIVRNAVFDRIFACTDRVKKLPKKQVERLYEKLVSDTQGSYEYAKTELNFPYADINDYAAAKYNYSLEEYPTMEDVCRAEAEETVTLRLLNFAIAQLAELRYSPEKTEQYYEVYLQHQIDGYTKPEYGIALTDEERAEIHLMAGDEKTDQLYEEMLHLFVKHYAIYEQAEVTVDDVKEIVGSKEDFLLDGLLKITEVNVQKYLYENNKWNDITP